LRSIFYTISYGLFGLDPIGYHVQSIIVNLVCVLLVYLIIFQITQKHWIAGPSALFFSVQPLHVEAITHMTPSFDTIGIAFMLLSFYAYLRDGKMWKYLSWASAAIAFFTDELTIVLPLMMILHDMLFARKKYPKIVKQIIPYFIFAFTYLFIRFVLLATPSRAGYLEGSFYLTMLAMVKVFFRYIQLLFVPFGLNHNHTISEGIFAFQKESLPKAILSQSIFDLNIIIPLLIMGVLFILAFCARKKHPLITFGAGIFLVGLAPVSQIIPLAQLMSERYVFVSSIGTCAILGYCIFLLMKKRKYQPFGIALLLVVTLFFGAMTYQRNAVWKDPVALWSDTVEKSPGSQEAYNNLGVSYMEKKDLADAFLYYNKALELNPDSPKTLNNVGIAYALSGNFTEAIKYYIKAITLAPNYTRGYYNLAVAYKQIGRDDLAKAALAKAKDTGTRYSEGSNDSASAQILR